MSVHVNQTVRVGRRGSGRVAGSLGVLRGLLGRRGRDVAGVLGGRKGLAIRAELRRITADVSVHINQAVRVRRGSGSIARGLGVLRRLGRGRSGSVAGLVLRGRERLAVRAELGSVAADMGVHVNQAVGVRRGSRRITRSLGVLGGLRRRRGRSVAGLVSRRRKRLSIRAELRSVTGNASVLGRGKRLAVGAQLGGVTGSLGVLGRLRRRRSGRVTGLVLGRRKRLAVGTDGGGSVAGNLAVLGRQRLSVRAELGGVTGLRRERLAVRADGSRGCVARSLRILGREGLAVGANSRRIPSLLGQRLAVGAILGRLLGRNLRDGDGPRSLGVLGLLLREIGRADVIGDISADSVLRGRSGRRRRVGACRSNTVGRGDRGTVGNGAKGQKGHDGGDVGTHDERVDELGEEFGNRWEEAVERVR